MIINNLLAEILLIIHIYLIDEVPVTHRQIFFIQMKHSLRVDINSQHQSTIDKKLT
jgi:hypothetical protein